MIGNRTEHRHVGRHQNRQAGEHLNIVGPLIAVSLLLLAGLGVVALFMAGSDSRSANDDDPEPRA